jgi:hypothetical protein
MLTSNCPSADPSNVTLDAPVAAPLTRTTSLAVGPASAYDNAAESDPAAIAAVLTTRRVPAMPPANLAPTALSDVHAVAPQALPPTRTQPLTSRPALLPSSVTLTAPVDGTFAASAPLTETPTAVNAEARIPICEAADATTE